jgi:hypothetical protein
MAKKKNQMSQRDKRALRTRQIIFVAIAVIIILSMMISLFVKI